MKYVRDQRKTISRHLNFSPVFHSSSYYKENPQNEIKHFCLTHSFYEICSFFPLCSGSGSASRSSSSNTNNESNNNHKGIRLKLRKSLKLLKNRRISNVECCKTKTHDLTDPCPLISFILNTILFHSGNECGPQKHKLQICVHTQIVIMKWMKRTSNCVHFWCVWFVRVSSERRTWDRFDLFLYTQAHKQIMDNDSNRLLIIVLLHFFPLRFCLFSLKNFKWAS